MPIRNSGPPQGLQLCGHSDQPTSDNRRSPEKLIRMLARSQQSFASVTSLRKPVRNSGPPQGLQLRSHFDQPTSDNRRSPEKLIRTLVRSQQSFASGICL
ncbi:hypothetical protein V6N11_003524 [Hibiscus sabdariffa]|uniref:Uncharacterized protein n=1 Tax=Hibiscus sabdariffa TaxID=183260 RepID=A0ABR2SEG8_9ROSI